MYQTWIQMLMTLKLKVWLLNNYLALCTMYHTMDYKSTYP